MNRGWHLAKDAAQMAAMGVVAYPVRELDLVHALQIRRLRHNRSQFSFQLRTLCTKDAVGHRFNRSGKVPFASSCC